MSIKQGANYKWLVFITVGIGTFMAVVDHGSVNIALPTISKHFDTDLPTVQWVSLGYALAVSALLLPAGRMADIFGRKEVYISGFIIFGLASALAGIAPNLWTLIAFKVSAAAGSAMLMANGMAILTSTFSSSERGKAVGTHMAIVGSGSIFGPVIGGLLVDTLGWRFVFFINLPIAVVGVATALVVLNARQLSQGRRQGDGGSFDWLGAGLSAGALILFLMAMTNGHRVGWASPAIAAGFAAAAVFLGLFLWRETVARAPMLDLGLFRNRTFSLGALSGFISFMATASIFFLMPFYLQSVLGYSARQAGLVMVSSAVCMALMGPIAGRLSDRFGWRPFNIGGAVLTALGALMISRVSPETGLGLVVPALILQGLGNGMFHSTNHASILSSVTPSKYGIASAFVNLNRNTASTTGLAIAIAIVVGTMSSMGFEPSLDAVTGGDASGVATAFTTGMRNVYLMASGLLVVVMVLSFFKGKRRLAEEILEPQAVPVVGGEETP